MMLMRKHEKGKMVHLFVKGNKSYSVAPFFFFFLPESKGALIQDHWSGYSTNVFTVT